MSTIPELSMRFITVSNSPNTSLCPPYVCSDLFHPSVESHPNLASHRHVTVSHPCVGWVINCCGLRPDTYSKPQCNDWESEEKPEYSTVLCSWRTAPPKGHRVAFSHLEEYSGPNPQNNYIHEVAKDSFASQMQLPLGDNHVMQEIKKVPESRQHFCKVQMSKEVG